MDRDRENKRDDDRDDDVQEGDRGTSSTSGRAGSSRNAGTSGNDRGNPRTGNAGREARTAAGRAGQIAGITSPLAQTRGVLRLKWSVASDSVVRHRFAPLSGSCLTLLDPRLSVLPA